MRELSNATQLGLTFQSDLDLKEVVRIKDRIVKMTKSLEYLYSLVIQSNSIFEKKTAILWGITSLEDWLEIVNRTLCLVPYFTEDYRPMDTSVLTANEVELDQIHRAYEDVKKNSSALITSFDKYPEKYYSPIYDNVLSHFSDLVVGLSYDLKYDAYDI